MTELGQLLGAEDPVSPEAPKRHMFIVVMGMPASGKSTLGKGVSEKLGFTHLRELSPAELGGFDDYYKDPDHNSYAVQTLFLDDAYQKLVQVPTLLKSRPVIFETPLWEHRFFALLRLANNPRLLEMYERYYEGLTRNPLPVPDLVIHLNLSLNEMRLRLEQRAAEEPDRKVELQEKVEFWSRLMALHEDWVRCHSDHLRIIIIKGDAFNFVRLGGKEKGKKLLYEEFVNQVRYACYRGEERRIPDCLIIPNEIENHRPRMYIK